MEEPHGRSPIAWILCLALVLPLLASGQDKEDRTLRLPLGDPKLKDKTMAVAAGEILAARTGEPIAFSRIIEELSGDRFVYVGESHDSLAMHDIQLQVVQALHAKSPDIAVGLEMLPFETQPVLDRWSQGLLSRDEFLRESRWYVHWSMNSAISKRSSNSRRPTKSRSTRSTPRARSSPRSGSADRDSLTEAEKAWSRPWTSGSRTIGP